MSRSDRDLDALADDLSDVLRDLRAELRSPRRDPGPFRPPTPRELLTFTERQAIPAAIGVLEANIRALELLGDAIRRVDRYDGRADRPDRERARPRATAASRPTLDRLETALDDLQDALDGAPAGAETRRLLDEARALREEIDRRLRETADRPYRARSSDTRAGAGRSPTAGGHEIPVDVEDELESIKRDLDEDGSNGG